MTYEEAFAILRDTPIDIRIPWNCEIYTQYATAQSIALDCIEKQIPKKPMVSKIVMFSITNGERKEEIVSHYHCPVCGRIVYEYDCCADNNCRQKIDWSDAE